MTTTYTRAITAYTAAEILAQELTIAATNEVDVAGFDQFSPQMALFQTNSRALAAEQEIRVDLAKAGFLTEAAAIGESWFDQALTWYDLDNGYGGKGRIPATAAVLIFKVSLAAGASPVTIAANSRSLTAQADDGTLYTSSNVVAVPIAAGSYGLVQFTCTTVGLAGNQSPGAVTHLIIGLPGLSVTNASPGSIVTGGRNVETSAEATARALAKWNTLGAGWTRASFDYLVPTFSPTVTRWLVRDDNPSGPGTIEIIAANGLGPSSAPENAAILAGLSADDVMTLGTGGLNVNSASTLTVTVTGSISGDGSNPTLLVNAKAALDLLRAKYPIGGNADGVLRLDLLTAILMGGSWPASAPLLVTGPSGTVSSVVLPGFGGALNVTLSAPAADVTFALTDVLVFNYAGLVVS